MGTAGAADPEVSLPQTGKTTTRKKGKFGRKVAPRPAVTLPSGAVGGDPAAVLTARRVEEDDEPPLTSTRLSVLRGLTVAAVIVFGAALGYFLRGTDDLRGVDRADVLARNWPVYIYNALLGVFVVGALVFLIQAGRATAGTPRRTRRFAYGAALAAFAVVGLAVRGPMEDALISNDDSTVDLTGKENPALLGTSVPKGERWVGAYQVLDKDEYSPAQAEEYVLQQRDAGISYASLVDGSKDNALADDPQGALDTNQFLVVFGWADTREGVESWCPLLDAPHEFCEARHVNIRD